MDFYVDMARKANDSVPNASHIGPVMPHSAIKVANELLARARSCLPPIPVTPLKIIKLVYIANGWASVLLNERLVEESAEAWTYGPVVPDLYHAVRRYRADPIEQPIPGGKDGEPMSERERSLIAAVFNAYGKLSGIQLSNLTHMPGTPWSTTWNDGRGQNEEIPQSLIESHYRHLSETRSNAALSRTTEAAP